MEEDPTWRPGVVVRCGPKEEVWNQGAVVTKAQRWGLIWLVVFMGAHLSRWSLFPGGNCAGGMRGGGKNNPHLDNNYVSNPAFIRYARGRRGGSPCSDAVRRGGSTNAGKISLTGQRRFGFWCWEFLPDTCTAIITSVRNQILRRPYPWQWKYPRPECGKYEADFQTGTWFDSMVPCAYLIGKMYAMGGEKRVKRLDFVSKKRDFEEWSRLFSQLFSEDARKYLSRLFR